MTTRNVRLSDDDIDRLLEWHAIVQGEGMTSKVDGWLRDRLVEAKLSPSMDWSAGWPDGGADKQWNTKPIQGIAVPRLLTFDDLPEPSTEEPGPQAPPLVDPNWGGSERPRAWVDGERDFDSIWPMDLFDHLLERSTEEPGER